MARVAVTGLFLSVGTGAVVGALIGGVVFGGLVAHAVAWRCVLGRVLR